MNKTIFINGIKDNTNPLSHSIETEDVLCNMPNPLDSLPRCGERILISSRKPPDIISQSSDHSPPIILPKDNHGRIIIQSRKKRQMQSEQDKSQIAEAFWNDEFDIIDTAPPPFEEKPHKSKKQKGRGKSKKGKKGKKDKKKKQKQKKKDLKGLHLELTEATSDKPSQVSSILSAITALSDNICIYDSAVYKYDDMHGAYYRLSKHDACVHISSMLKQRLKYKCSVKDVKDAYQKILWEKDLQVSKLEKFNTPYVNCKNGVLNLESMELLPHSPKYGFTSCCNANYNEECEGAVFKEFIKTLTNGDKSLKKLIQEVLGYCLSNYVNAKKAFLLYGVSNSGKSVLLNLLTCLVGSENISNVDLQHMNNPTYVAQLADKKLNIAPDMPGEPVKDIGTFKSLVSNLDTIESRKLYNDPKRQQCNCKLIFASNQAIKLLNAEYGNVEAFFNRLIILPCLHTVPEDEQDFFLTDKLKEELDYILTWALQGASRLISNNFQFSDCSIAERIKKQHMQTYCIEKIFCDECLDFSDDKAISLTTEIHKLFDDFCNETGEKGNKNSLKQFLANNHQISCKRKRLHKDENPRYVYVGVSPK